LGATLFRLLSGRRVHLAGNAAEALIAAATRVAPRITSVVPDVPADLAHTVDRALAFELGARWQDARCMQRALESREAHPEDGEPFETTLGDSRSCASGPPQAPSVETAVARSGPQRSDGKIADARAPAAHDSWPLAGIGLSLLVVLALAAGGFAWRAIREHADDPRDVAGALAKSAIPSAEPGPQATASARVKRSQGEPRAAPPEVPAPRGEEAAPAPRRTVRSPDPSPRTARASRPQEAAPRIQESDSDRTRRLLSEREPKVSWRRHSRSALHQRGELSTPPNGSSLRR